MGFGWKEIDKTLDLGYIRVTGLQCECKPAVLFEPPNFRPRTMTHVCTYTHVCMYVHMLMYVCTYMKGANILTGDRAVKLSEWVGVSGELWLQSGWVWVRMVR